MDSCIPGTPLSLSLLPRCSTSSGYAAGAVATLNGTGTKVCNSGPVTNGPGHVPGPVTNGPGHVPGPVAMSHVPVPGPVAMSHVPVPRALYTYPGSCTCTQGPVPGARDPVPGARSPGTLYPVPGAQGPSICSPGPLYVAQDLYI